MKKRLLAFGALTILATAPVVSQTISTFDNLNLATADTFWHSTTPVNSFVSGYAVFPSMYDTTYDYWSSGWAYSNQTDSSTLPSSPSQLFAAKAGSGYMSPNYGVGQNNAVVNLISPATGGQVNGVWITNSNYAYNSMKLGDFVGKQFGGTTGNDTDWFKVTIMNYYNGSLTGNSVDFYLADFRFSNNSQDYIVNDWRWVDLSSLGNSDSLIFSLSSTDVGTWGMNTPAFFCIDHLETADSPTGLAELNNSALNASPNPTHDWIAIACANLTGSQLMIYNSVGQLIENRAVVSDREVISLTNFESGVYHVVVIGEDGLKSTLNFIRN